MIKNEADFFKFKRFGFACKIDQKNPKKINKKFNFISTNLKNFSILSEKNKEEKIRNIVDHNLNVLNNVFEWLYSLPVNLRMYRIGSDIFPFYTIDQYRKFYDNPEFKNYYTKRLSDLGDKSRNYSIRLSFHPGQFTILNSSNQKVLDNSLKEIEYHSDIFRFMNFPNEWHPYGIEINIHGGTKKNGIDYLINNIKKLSNESKNWISIENDEYSFGIRDLLKLENICAIILDVHHHFIFTKGSYISVSDDIITVIKNSWRGIVPELHYSISPEEISHLCSNENFINYRELIENNYSSRFLRKHSNSVWHKKSNQWISEFSEIFDIMIEAKNKNLASIELYNFFIQNNLPMERHGLPRT
jgi:UV DNA damage endonuclease